MRCRVLALVIAALVALPLAASLPTLPHLSRLLLDTRARLARRAYSTDLSQFEFVPYVLSDLSILCERLEANLIYLCSLNFDWFDPNSVRQNRVTSGRCETAWEWDGVTRHNASYDGSNAAAEYQTCWADEETYFKASVPDFWHPGNFSLELAHHYHDDENFTKPWDYPTTFAEARIRLCEEELTDSMYHHHPGPINASVVGIID